MISLHKRFWESTETFWKATQCS